MKRRLLLALEVLAVVYSQTGQTARAVAHFLEPFAASGAHIVHAPLMPIEPPPFPWSFFGFFGMMAHAVRGPWPQLAPLEFAVDRPYDLVVLAFPPWFLHPAPAMNAFLVSTAASVLAGKPVVLIATARDMWASALADVTDQVHARGGRVVAEVVVSDPSPRLVSVVTTPRWLLTGKRDRLLGLLPPAGIPGASYGPFTAAGQRVLAAASRGFRVSGEPLRALPDPANAFPERVGRASFRWWANIIERSARHRSLQRLVIGAFFLYLVIIIPPLFVVGRGLALSLVGKAENA